VKTQQTKKKQVTLPRGTGWVPKHVGCSSTCGHKRDKKMFNRWFKFISIL